MARRYARPRGGAEGTDVDSRYLPASPRAGRQRLLVILATAFVALIAPATAAAEPFVPAGLLEGAAANPNATLHLIVVAAPGTSTGHLKNEVMKDANGNQFGSVRREYEVVPALAVDIKASDLHFLADSDRVHSVTPDGPVREQALSSPWSPLELWPGAVNAPALWPRTLRSAPRPPAIAIVDSGIQDGLLDFGSRVDSRVDVSSFSSGSSGDDGFGHGTMVAGIAAGASPLYPGVAPTARLMSVRAVDSQGRSRIADVLAAADWIYHNRISKGIGVVNFSIRSTHPNYGLYDPINLAVERLWHTGTVVVAAAGNDGPGRMLYAPASDPFVITVGAVDLAGTTGAQDDFNAPWSSHGHTAEGFAKPELAAPGRHMVAPVPPASTLARAFPERVVAPGYMWMSGTSFSAPVVSGAAAQLLARHPDWTPDEVKGALMLTARELSSADPLSAGVGEVDVAAAAAVTDPPNPNENLYDFVETDPSGRPYFDAEAWNAHVSADATWTSATWTSATWTSATWTSATWTSASWTSSAHADATWTSATWTSATWTSATWTSATWTSATWTSATGVE
jgi:serine protease AprX